MTRPYRGGRGAPAPVTDRSLPSTFGDVYAQVANDLRTRLGASLAQEAGVPQSQPQQAASDAARVEAWNQAHPEATDDAMWAMAQQKIAEHTQAGMATQQAIAATAEDLTHFRYRARQPLYTLGTTTWGEQVAEAERLSKLARKQETTETPETPPQPPTNPPQDSGPPVPGAQPGPTPPDVSSESRVTSRESSFPLATRDSLLATNGGAPPW